jgi:hypothetical protein
MYGNMKINQDNQANISHDNNVGITWFMVKYNKMEFNLLYIRVELEQEYPLGLLDTSKKVGKMTKN